MTVNRQRWLQITLVVTLIFSGFSSILNMVADAGETCSTHNCVEFVQFGVTIESEAHCRKGIFSERWAFQNACCAPSANPDWCSTQDLLSLGPTTRMVLDSCTPVCSSTSCADSQIQAYVTNMLVEYVTAVRYKCIDDED